MALSHFDCFPDIPPDAVADESDDEGGDDPDKRTSSEFDLSLKKYQNVDTIVLCFDLSTM